VTARWIPAETGARVIGLRWGYSPEKYEFSDFDSPQAAADYAGGDSFVEIVTVRNPRGGVFTFEGRFLPTPSAAMQVGTVVEGVWYTVPQEDQVYEDFPSARARLAERPDPPTWLQEHLRLRGPDGRVIEQEARILNLDPRWSPVSRRYANAY